ncbi:hypothetical protein [Pseudooceanicola sp.]|uniref:hypothetical protein n=1 Tax=Pseudooceanicola sp. TaxID=1914328 RepID=UPI002612234C|nr:hypothetical protein [Pseudooceanicola sp.]MDF1855204.1 hypothetical protein [Pseudooceanicola sp.]
MSTYLSKELNEGLQAAHRLVRARNSRMRVRNGQDVYPVIRFWDAGFSVEAEVAPHLRGFVDILDGGRHLFQCLIVASDEEAGEIRYEFKRATAASDTAPLDFAPACDAPVGLIGKS